MEPLRRDRLFSWIKAHWPLIRKIIVVVFVILIISLLSLAVTRVDWDEVLDAIERLPATTLAMAALFTLSSYLLYSCFDLLGKRYTGHGLAWWRAMMVGFISYAFTMNMGAPVGGIGLRMRLYTKQDLQPGVVARVMGFSIATNWMGYVLLAGVVFAMGKPPLPADWELGQIGLRLIGAAMVLAVAAYVLLCRFSTKRSWSVHGHVIELPSFPLALTHLAIAALNWSLMGAVIYTLLQFRVEYPTVLGTLLVSAVAGVITHIPGGLGVIEAVFIALLASPDLPRFEILAAVLAYRGVYYLAPLLVAGAWYLVAEVRINRARAT